VLVTDRYPPFRLAHERAALLVGTGDGSFRLQGRSATVPAGRVRHHRCMVMRRRGGGDRPAAPSRPTRASGPAPAAGREGLALAEAGALEAARVLERLGSSEAGLGAAEAQRRLHEVGPNAVRSHAARPLAVLARQLKSPLLLLLVVAALVSVAVGEHASAAIILAIVGLSVGLGFVNEFRSEQAVEALHNRIRHTAVALRDGRAVAVDVTELVPGDLVRLGVGEVVPADLRLLEATGLECQEAVLTGEPLPVPKTSSPARGGSPLDLPSCALMGTVVHAGAGRGVVVATGPGTAFGQIALRLGERHEETAFQRGLRDFSRLLVRVTELLAVSIFLINAVLRRPLLESALFALAIAVGLTPQLLPAIVTVSLSTGARRLARARVVVKRLVAIEDLGNIEVLCTDKTGTLTQGRIRFEAALDAAGAPAAQVLRLGLACNEAVVEGGRVVGGNQLDQALWEAALGSGGAADAGGDGAGPAGEAAVLGGTRRLATAPFDYDRRLVSVLVAEPGGRRLLITKGAPEVVLARCRQVPAAAAGVLDRLFAAGSRVVAVATRDGAGLDAVGRAEERDLALAGFLTFTDPPKPGAAASLHRLRALGIEVKVVTGDNDRVAAKVCGELGIPVSRTLTGAELDELDDAALAAAVPATTVFARVTPEQKSRVIRAARGAGRDVAFLGDGVNDAVALHDADVGVSVEGASDVAKDAADVVLLEKDLGVLADGVVEGRRIFANTIKYVLMGTSSNFGNMFSAAGASLFLSFLPMLPTQILLNNLLYDVSEMTIPTDTVDAELLERPSRWDTGFIRRFMAFFGPISSLFDFATFGVLLWVLHAGPTEFRSGWFIESLATQTLVVFVIRTRRVPFWRSRPSRPLLLTTLACATVGVLLPYSPLAGLLGFAALPPSFLLILAGMVAVYLGLAEAGKAWFFRPGVGVEPLAGRRPHRQRRIERRAARWSHPALPAARMPARRRRGRAAAPPASSSQ
jgi:Mg2+-importing ATPase